MAASPPDTDELLDRIASGDAAARNGLLDRHRSRLRRMIDVHLDDRLRTRLDPSDVVQETLAEAAGRLSDFARRRPLPFYPWLRAIAWDKLRQLRQHHLQTQKRSVLREVPGRLGLPNSSVMELAQRLVASNSSPSQRLIRDELRQRVRQALDQLSERDREVLILRYLEQLPPRDAVAVLGISEDAYMKRHLRALARLRTLLDRDNAGGAP
jgi:RNA polymerase sigma-70 factor (ECF subfamily)